MSAVSAIHRPRPYTLRASDFPISPNRRVLARDDAVTLGHKLLELIGDPNLGVFIEHVSRAMTKVANGNVLAMDDGDTVKIRFASSFGNGFPVTVYHNQLDDTTLRKIVQQAKAMAPPQVVFGEPDDPDDARHFVYNPRPLPSVNLWHDASVQAMTSARGTVIPQMVERLRASKLTGAATVGQMSRAVLHIYPLGLTSFAEETDCEVTVTARSPDGKGSGWNGQANRDWTKMTPMDVVDRAVEMSNRSHNPVALEPGRRTAILGPAAVAQLVYAMAELFDAAATNVPWGGTPLTYQGHSADGRRTKLGMRVFDPRLMMVSDPNDPDGGYPPFFDEGGKEQVTGFPTPGVTWVDKGILRYLSYGINEATSRRLIPSDIPYSVRLAPVPGTQTATIDEMIANCKEGVYVNRFSNVQLVDHPSGMMTGVTRDGCFFIKDGKIAKPITNFRFTDSPFFAFNKMEMVGAAERASFGNTAPVTMLSTYRRGWPRLPVIVPPMMVQDFNFSATASAV